MMLTGDFLYCQACGKGNEEALSRKRRLDEAAKQKEALIEKRKLQKMEESNAELKRQLQEKEAIIKRQEEEIMEKSMVGISDDEASRQERDKLKEAKEPGEIEKNSLKGNQSENDGKDG